MVYTRRRERKEQLTDVKEGRIIGHKERWREKEKKTGRTRELMKVRSKSKGKKTGRKKDYVSYFFVILQVHFDYNSNFNIVTYRPTTIHKSFSNFQTCEYDL